MAINYSRTYLETQPHWPYKCCLSRQMVFGDRLNYIEIQDLLAGIAGLSRHVVSHTRQVLLYNNMLC